MRCPHWDWILLLVLLHPAPWDSVSPLLAQSTARPPRQEPIPRQKVGLLSAPAAQPSWGALHVYFVTTHEPRGKILVWSGKTLFHYSVQQSALHKAGTQDPSFSLILGFISQLDSQHDSYCVMPLSLHERFHFSTNHTSGRPTEL